jgi:hypothetical protein
LYSIHWIKGRKKGTTDHIREIQGIIDVHQGGTPTSTEVARVVMKNTQSLYDIHANMYKLTWTTVKSHAHVEHVVDEDGIPRVKLVHKTQSLIVETMDHRPDPSEAESGNPWKMNATEMPDQGMVLASWINNSCPCCLTSNGSDLFVLHSIVPYEPKKRLRGHSD